MVAAPAAWAGEIWVTDGAGSCNAFSFYGDLASFIAPSSCPMSIQANAAIPLGQNAYWMTTAPAGITINSAWTADGDVNAGNWTTGVVVGDFWRDINTGAYGGSTLAQGQQWLNTGLEGSSNINSQIYGIQIVCAQSNWSFGGCGYTNPPWVTVSGIELEGTENAEPFVTGEGALWTARRMVRSWHTRGGERASGLEAPFCVDLGVDRGAERRGPSPARTISPPLPVQTRAILRAMARGVFKLFTDASIQGSWRGRLTGDHWQWSRTRVGPAMGAWIGWHDCDPSSQATVAGQAFLGKRGTQQAESLAAPTGFRQSWPMRTSK